VLAVIMAGGTGERFWPQSRLKRPKQLLNLTGKGSLIELTVERLRNLSKPEEIYIITNIDQFEGVRREVPQIPTDNIIAEPERKNTAPCIGLACHFLKKRFGNRPVIVLPADHIIEPLDKFERVVRAGEDYVSKHDVLITFGIKPTRPDTGYGYIRAGEKLTEVDGIELYRSDGFFEKPDVGQAREFTSRGGYYWNSGMFMWKVNTVLNAIARFLPELSSALLALEDGTKATDEVLKGIYKKIPSESIDYGVMEKAANVVVLEGDFYWNDVGNWESIRELFSSDEDGNVLVGDHIIIDGRENTILSSQKVVGLIGLDDIVVVNGGDAILVCKRTRVQEVKKVVARLRDGGKEDLI
jgi:mannose-1-phosphate guanylyltransferase